MSTGRTPLPIYEGLLELATPNQRQQIDEGGPPKNLAAHIGTPGKQAAYKAIYSILSGLIHGGSARITGLDLSTRPPARVFLPPEFVRSGRLSWHGPTGAESRLTLRMFEHEFVYVELWLHLENENRPAVIRASPPSIEREENERIIDNERLRRMQALIEDGHLKYEAARSVARDMPLLNTTEDASIRRLVRKWDKRSRVR